MGRGGFLKPSFLLFWATLDSLPNGSSTSGSWRADRGPLGRASPGSPRSRAGAEPAGASSAWGAAVPRGPRGVGPSSPPPTPRLPTTSKTIPTRFGAVASRAWGGGAGPGQPTPRTKWSQRRLASTHGPVTQVSARAGSSMEQVGFTKKRCQ